MAVYMDTKEPVVFCCRPWSSSNIAANIVANIAECQELQQAKTHLFELGEAVFPNRTSSYCIASGTSVNWCEFL